MEDLLLERQVILMAVSSTKGVVGILTGGGEVPDSTWRFAQQRSGHSAKATALLDFAVDGPALSIPVRDAE